SGRPRRGGRRPRPPPRRRRAAPELRRRRPPSSRDGIHLRRPGRAPAGCPRPPGMIVGVTEPAWQGRRIIQADIIGTAIFRVVTVVEVVVMAWMRTVAVAVDLGLFAVGCATFLGSYAIALNRSRTDEIGVASLYLLTNKVAPKPV